MPSRLYAAPVALLLMAAGPQAADLPNPSLTPGAARSGMDVATVCSTRWGLDERHVTAKMKREVFASYGYPKGNKDPRCACEIDHLIPRELGGADVVENLWVQSFRGEWNAHDKDRLENKVHKMVCTGAMTLAHARKAMASDWINFYEKLFNGGP